jgi:chromatin remodeling complex protein RSC6
MFLKPTSSWSFTLPHFAHRKRNEKKEKNLSGPYLVFQKKQNSVAQKDPSYASHPNREKPHGPSCFVAGAKTGKKKRKSNKNSRNPPGMRGFSLAAEKRGASAECVGVDLRQSRGRNMIVPLRAVD